MSARLTTRLAAFLAVLLWPVAAWGETLSTPQYRLRIHPDAKITQRVDTGWEVYMTVELAGERARVRWKSDGFTAIFPTGTLRAQLGANATPQAFELTTDFEGRRYQVTRSPREVSWVLPGQEVFFRTFGGKISNVVGTSDFLKITRDSRGGRLSLESGAGSSDVLLKKGALEVFDGPDVLDHLYFVRGLAFQRGPLTLEIPLPEEPFLNALPANRYLLVPSTQLQPANPDEPSAGSLPAEEPLSGDPLDAQPPNWDSPVYRANAVDNNEDPLNSRREIRYPAKDRPLDAKTAPDSEEILRVQNY